MNKQILTVTQTDDGYMVEADTTGEDLICALAAVVDFSISAFQDLGASREAARNWTKIAVERGMRGISHERPSKTLDWIQCGDPKDMEAIKAALDQRASETPGWIQCCDYSLEADPDGKEG